MVLTYLHVWMLVVEPFKRLLDSIVKHFGAADLVLSMPKPSATDYRLHDVCAVCLSTMDATNARLTPCGHVFHGKCLKLSLRATRDCPMCRHQLLTKAIL